MMLKHKLVELTGSKNKDKLNVRLNINDLILNAFINIVKFRYLEWDSFCLHRFSKQSSFLEGLL